MRHPLRHALNVGAKACGWRESLSMEIAFPSSPPRGAPHLSICLLASFRYSLLKYSIGNRYTFEAGEQEEFCVHLEGKIRSANVVRAAKQGTYNHLFMPPSP